MLGAVQVSVCQKAYTYWFGDAEEKQLPDKCRNLSGQVSDKWYLEKAPYLHVLKNKYLVSNNIEKC